MNTYQVTYVSDNNLSTVIRDFDADLWHTGTIFTHFADENGESLFSVSNERVITIELITKNEEPKDA